MSQQQYMYPHPPHPPAIQPQTAVAGVSAYRMRAYIQNDANESYNPKPDHQPETQRRILHPLLLAT